MSIAVALAAFAALAALAGCTSLTGPRTIVLSEADVARQLAKQFPMERKLLGELTVRVEAPRVSLLRASNRIATELDFNGSLSRSGKSSRGTMALDYALRYVEAAQAVRMTQVRVGKVSIDGLNDSSKATVDKFGSLLAEQLLNDAIIYRFKSDDLKTAEGKGYRPGTVTVSARGVEISLVPVIK